MNKSVQLQKEIIVVLVITWNRWNRADRGMNGIYASGQKWRERNGPNTGSKVKR